MKWCYPRHSFGHGFAKCVMWPYLKIRYGFKAEKFKMEKNKPYLILANHRGFWDPILLGYVYNRPIYFMATDNIFNNGFVSKLLTYWLAPIPKKKQAADLKAVRAAKTIASERGVVGIFPEGSRSFDGESTSIDVGVAQLAKLMKADILLCGMYGIYASDPRWGVGNRRGKSLLKTTRVITADEAAAMDDEQLRQTIADELSISEAPTELVASADKIAEKLESFLYVCPKCGSVCTIYSHGNTFGCTSCGMKGTMNPDLSLNFEDESVKISNLAQWHKIQKKFGREFKANAGQVIFTDNDIEFTEADQKNGKKLPIGKGKLALTDNCLIFTPKGGEELSINIDKIKIISPVGMKKLVITSEDKTYYLEGRPGFNGYKYTQIYYTLTGQPDREVK